MYADGSFPLLVRPYTDDDEMHPVWLPDEESPDGRTLDLSLPQASWPERDVRLEPLLVPVPDDFVWGRTSIIVDLENNSRSLTGAIVRRGGNWYFYKLTGGAAAVAAAREEFINYCKAGS